MSTTEPSALRLPGAHSPYWVQSPLEIRQLFRGLQRKAERVILAYGHDQTIVSTVLDVDARGHLHLDVGPDERANRKLLETPVIVFRGYLDGVELQGELGPLHMGSHDGLPAFTCAPPLRLHRLQRREFHRVSIPVGHKVRCLLPPSDGKAPVTAGLLDISVGGLRLLDPQSPGMKLDGGETLRSVRVELGDTGSFVVDLEVRYRHTVTTRSGQSSYKVGCRFGRLPMGAEQLLQRYIIQTERDLRVLQVD